eukprot:CAMPEP_0114546214 /NCGR_PEP_ID=MMETSP0114-20121206/3816_1 /TAXON_ID=31324 /ORGANISM="Goniomonas sp, Strain m" /LENGTH=1136 /DNA_ID=CAMNT_0001730697 /DNA_START=10 /DNA_END=3417 /DNA_ORIENTATION=+
MTRCQRMTVYDKVASLELATLDEADNIEPFLPFLASMALGDTSSIPLGLLFKHPEMSRVQKYLEVVDFDRALEGFHAASKNPPELDREARVDLDFERADHSGRVRLVLAELALITHPSSKFEGTILSTPAFREECCCILSLIVANSAADLNVPSIICNLMRIVGGESLAVGIVNNAPGSLQRVVRQLLTSGLLGVEAVRDRIQRTLEMLASGSLVAALQVRAALIDAQLLPLVALQITLQYINDPLAFLTAHLLNSRIPSTQSSAPDLVAWNWQAVLKPGSLQYPVAVRPILAGVLTASSGAHTPDLCAVLRLYCFLVGPAGWALDEIETEAVLDKLEHLDQLQAPARRLTLCLCLCAFSKVLPAKFGEVLRRAWATTATKCSLFRLLLVLLSARDLVAVGDIVRAMVGCAVTVYGDALSQLVQAAAQAVPEADLCSAVAAAQPCARDYDELPLRLDLDLECVSVLSRSGAFTRRRLDVGECVLRHLVAATTPASAQLPTLIDLFTPLTAPAPAASGTAAFRMAPLPPARLAPALESGTLVVKLAVVLYLVSRRDQCRAAAIVAIQTDSNLEQRVFDTRQAGQSRPSGLSRARSTQMCAQAMGPSGCGTGPDEAALLDKTPIRRLLREAERNFAEYQALYIPIVGLCLQHLPQLFTPPTLVHGPDVPPLSRASFQKQQGAFVSEDNQPLQLTTSGVLLLTWLRERASVPSTAPAAGTGLFDLALDALVDAASGAHRVLAAAALEVIYQVLVASAVSADAVSRCVDVLLDHTLAQVVARKGDCGAAQLRPAFLRVWRLVFIDNAWDFGLRAARAVLKLSQGPLLKAEEGPPGTKSSRETVEAPAAWTHSVLTRQPVLLLDITEVLVDPLLLQIILPVFAMYQVASSEQVATQTELLKGAGAGKEVEGEASSLLLVQHSYAVQRLLKALQHCETSSEEAASLTLHSVICAQLHAMFLEAPLLVKLVHFQGYDASLLPGLVQGVPSLHLCLEFLQELLAQPLVETQIFAVQLTARLGMQYPIPQSLASARVALARVRDAAATTHAQSFLEHTLPSVELLAVAFPTLTDEIIQDLLVLAPPRDDGAPSRLQRLVVQAFLRIVTANLSRDGTVYKEAPPGDKAVDAALLDSPVALAALTRD